MQATQVQVRPIIGMEIHVQLATVTKMFCSCPLEFAAEPNSRTCPVCLGLPGALPVMNARAFELAVRAGLALHCTIATFTKWDRKSYYYPDLPKNYQISQYDLPLASQGYFEVPTESGLKKIRIRRAHLEEDAGKNMHVKGGWTQVDLNRAGTPLLEIVTEPDLAGAEEAYLFATELQKLMVYLGVSEANMQKGQMRFEPNINVAIIEDGVEYRTPISEVKNLNSFRSLRSAIAFEVKRQAQAWEDDRDYVFGRRGNENRGWDDVREVTEFQRGKEAAHDYRYFPDPDLVPVELTESWIDQRKKMLPELPVHRRLRYVKDYDLSLVDAETISSDLATGDLFEEAIRQGADVKVLGKQFINFWARHANEARTAIAGLGIDAARLAELSRITSEGRINPTAAATVAEKMLKTGRSPSRIAAEDGLEQTQDSDAIAAWVAEAIAQNPKAADDVRTKSKKADKALGFLQGHVMRASRGTAPAQRVRQLLEEQLGRTP